MSIVNTNLERAREPLVKRLPQGRLEVERWFKIKDRRLGTKSKITAEIFGGYDLLDGAALAGTHEITAKYPDDNFADCRLIEERTEEVFLPGGKTIFQLYQRYQTLTDSWALQDQDKPSATENGLRLVDRVQVARRGTTAPYDEDDIGIVTTTNGGKTLILAGFDDDSTDSVGRFITRWAEAGILDADHEFARDGLLYVTFISQGTKFTPTALKAGKALTDIETEAFQGGDPADIRYSRVKDVSGFRKYTVTIMLLQDGSPLVNDGTDNVLHSYQKYESYQRPGSFTLSAGGIEGIPGNNRFALVEVSEVLSTDSDLAASYKPYSVKSWASYTYSYVPSETGIAVVKTGAASGYLGSGSFASSGGKLFDMDVDNASGSAGSDPSPDTFNALEDRVIDSDNQPAFTTDTGAKWYRKLKVQMVGTMAANIGAV